MQQTMQVTKDIYWLGANDRRLALFEGVYPIPRGVSYNAYLILDEKTVLMDTVDKAVSGQFFENLAHLLAGRPLDYVVVQHMEPDHAATLEELLLRHPETVIVCNSKSMQMMRQFFTFRPEEQALVVGEGDVLETGNHTLNFVMAPMVHWPEVMVTFDSQSGCLFSADAFGCFGALPGNIFADELPFLTDWMPDARRYYTNIVGKYGTQVQTLLKKAKNLPIQTICPLHGPIWRKNLHRLVEKYDTWSRYAPEENKLLIAYASIYGNTENAACVLAGELAKLGVTEISMFDLSVTHPSEVVAEAFRCSHLVFAASSYNAGLFTPMETLLLDLAAHNLQNRKVALIENGSWAPTAGGKMQEILSGCKNLTYLGDKITLRSSLKQEQANALQQLAALIAKDLAEDANPEAEADEAASGGEGATGKVDVDALYKLSYGVFFLTAKEGDKDNGCVINTAQLVTDSPKQISVTVNKQNFTHDMILNTGELNLSVLNQDATFGPIEHFGFASGRNQDKFANTEHLPVTVGRSQNGLCYLAGETNAFISGRVVQTVDLGTHTLFVAKVTEAKLLNQQKSLTYADYFDHVKPKPSLPEEPVKGFICKICGYIYQGDTLPADYICPLCKHGAEDFEPIGQ